MDQPAEDVSSLKIPKRKGPALNAVLFAATLVSTWFAGLVGDTLHEQLQNGFIYMASLIGILLSHEMGHYIMARRNRVDASLPYFIPVPAPLSLFGTLGAVIVMRGRIRSRNALMEVGAAGPLTGVAVAIPILLIGLALSPVQPLISAPNAIIEGQSLLYMLLKRIAVGPIPEGYDVILHPMAWAGWIGLLVTMLNLLPIGQLDGGHISYALCGERHAVIARLFLAALPILGLGVMGMSALEAREQGFRGPEFWLEVLTGANWLVLGALLFFAFGRGKRKRHPPTDDNALSPGHFAVGIACAILFILTFTPIPLRML